MYCGAEKPALGSIDAGNETWIVSGAIRTGLTDCGAEPFKRLITPDSVPPLAGSAILTVTVIVCAAVEKTPSAPIALTAGRCGPV